MQCKISHMIVQVIHSTSNSFVQLLLSVYLLFNFDFLFTIFTSEIYSNVSDNPPGNHVYIQGEEFIAFCWRHHIYMLRRVSSSSRTCSACSLSVLNLTFQEANILLLQHLSPIYLIKAAFVKTDTKNKLYVRMRRMTRTKFIK